MTSFIHPQVPPHRLQPNHDDTPMPDPTTAENIQNPALLTRIAGALSFPHSPGKNDQQGQLIRAEFFATFHMEINRLYQGKRVYVKN
jgi:hypothetical protein